jgi:MFS family permease
MIHLLSTLFSLVIIQLYKRCLSSLSFKTIVTTGRFVVLSCIFIHYLIIQGYTVKYADNYSLFLISGPIQFAAKEFSLLPVQVLAGSLCPKKLEGTVYAVFVSGISFGTAIGNLIGSYIMGKLKIGKGHYDNFGFFLKILIIMGFVPIVMLLFIKREMLETKKKTNNKIKDKKDIDLQKGQV